eukprot:1159148-Pelagomonas_calceolata.AAC.6
MTLMEASTTLCCLGECWKVHKSIQRARNATCDVVVCKRPHAHCDHGHDDALLINSMCFGYSGMQVRRYAGARFCTHKKDVRKRHDAGNHGQFQTSKDLARAPETMILLHKAVLF